LNIDLIQKWKQDLQSWAIPEEIIRTAQESPWIHPPVLFQIPDKIEENFSHQIAREALFPKGSVLDIGCGGGIATFANSDVTNLAIGVDHQREMIEMYEKNAKDRGIEVKTIEGFWPEVAEKVETTDVVLCHHVVYNVQDIERFLKELNSHARKRVVIEMPYTHPLSNMNKAWKHFWKLDRPENPTAGEFFKIVESLGYKPEMKKWQGEIRSGIDQDLAAKFLRIRLCLPKNREGDVKEFMNNNPESKIRDLVTIWWDK
jgi:SAM-dependent methyltransferase